MRRGLSEEDRLNCKPKDKIKDGMQIVVQRVTTEEAVEKEEIPHETAYGGYGFAL